MRTRTTTAAALTAASLLLTLTSCGYSADDCAAALTNESTKTDRPTECQDISDEDYDTLLTAYIIKKTLNDMDQDDQDLLDYHDDGSINDSLTD